MANSKETKQAIRLEIERLESRKAPLKARLAETTILKEKLLSQMDEINASIEKLKVDLG